MKLTDVTPNLIVSDIARSTAFYRDVLDFRSSRPCPRAPLSCSSGCSVTA